MGKPKKRWTSEEETALFAGVNKYGTGKWKDILTDKDFASCLIKRSNVDLKDKWRNLSCNSTSPPQSPLLHKQTQVLSCRIWRMMTAAGSMKLLFQIIIIIAVVTIFGLGIQTRWKLPLMLPMLKVIWLEIYYTIPRKLVKIRWKDLKRFLKRVWRFYKWLERSNQKVKYHGMV